MSTSFTLQNPTSPGLRLRLLTHRAHGATEHEKNCLVGMARAMR